MLRTADREVIVAKAAAAVHTARGAGAGLLDAVSEPGRTVLELRLVGGLTVDEVATALNLSPEAVRVHQHHALNVLRARQG